MEGEGERGKRGERVRGEEERNEKKTKKKTACYRMTFGPGGADDRVIARKSLSR